MSWEGELHIMEERLRVEMANATKPFDRWTSLKCLAILNAFGFLSTACYPLLWVGLVLVSFLESTQLYAPPLVVCIILGTIYLTNMLMIYYVNSRFHVPLLDMGMALIVAAVGLVLATIAERQMLQPTMQLPRPKASANETSMPSNSNTSPTKKAFASPAANLLSESLPTEVDVETSLLAPNSTEMKAATSPQRRLLALFKFTVTPIATLSCLLPFTWHGAFLCASALVILVKVFRGGLQKLCWSRPKSGEPLRVMICGDAFPPKLDGVQIFSRNTIQALVQEGHKVHVFCSNGSPTTLLAPENYGATVTRGPGIEVQPKHKITLPSPHFLLALLRFQPNIVHFSDFTPMCVFLMPFLWWLGIPFLMAHHSRIDLYATYVPTFIGDYSPQVVRALFEVLFPLVTGHLILDKSQKHQSWFQEHPLIRHWPTGVDLELFHPSKACQEMREMLSNGRPDLPLVIFVGRLSPEKQVDKFIDLVKLTNPKGQPEVCRFAIIGHGDSWEPIHRQLGHRPDVYMPGALTSEKLAAAFASGDIFFSPTVTGTADMVWFESQAAGLAVVGPNATEVPLLVTNGVNGELYEPLDMEDAKRAILKIIGGQNLEKMKVAARENAEANFTWPRSTGAAIKFYKDVLQFVERYG